MQSTCSKQILPTRVHSICRSCAENFAEAPGIHMSSNWAHTKENRCNLTLAGQEAEGFSDWTTGGGSGGASNNVSLLRHLVGCFFIASLSSHGEGAFVFLPASDCSWYVVHAALFLPQTVIFPLAKTGLRRVTRLESSALHKRFILSCGLHVPACCANVRIICVQEIQCTLINVCTVLQIWFCDCIISWASFPGK